MNRYMERAENIARFVDVNLTLTLDLPEETGHWGALVTTMDDDPAFLAHYGKATRGGVMRFLTFDTANPNSILSCLYAARENARSVREIISSEMWEQVNRAYLSVKETAARDPALNEAHDFFTRVKLASHLFAGISDATFSHGEGYHFGNLGRYLERADKTSRMLDVKYFMLLPDGADIGSPLDNLQWSAVLKSASALEMYRKKVRRRITPGDVADFLILDREFPRSIRHSVAQAEQALHLITGSTTGTFGNEAEKRLGKLRAELDYTDVNDIFARGLHEFLQNLQDRINHVGDGIQETFFAFTPLSSSPSQGLPQ